MSSSNIQIGIIGAGRIGKIHAENLATRIPGVSLAGIADVQLTAAQELARKLNAPLATADCRQLLGLPGLNAVVVCSATDTHAEIVQAAAASGKHIFCEKPIDLDLARIAATLQSVARAGVKFQVGFNRRFDPSFAKARELVAAGKIGVPQVVRITSRDPAPPPLSYVRVSGGIFLDMAIHDFDMVRFLTGSEAVDVYAIGAALINPEVERLGDVDTCVTTMRLANGALATIDNSRQAVYGYDQRIEVFGSAGVVSVGHRTPDSHVLANLEGVHSAKPQYFFLERYEESYIAEMRAFVDCVQRDTAPPVSGNDGLMPVRMGLAAKKSLTEKRPVSLSEIQ